MGESIDIRKLKQYTIENTVNNLDKGPRIRIQKSGTFYFNKQASDLFGFNINNHVSFYHGANGWYISITGDKKGFTVKPANKGLYYSFNATKLAGIILSSVHATKASVEFVPKFMGISYGESVYKLSRVA